MKFGIFPVEGGDWHGVVDQCRLAEDVGFESCWVNGRGRELLAGAADAAGQHRDRYRDARSGLVGTDRAAVPPATRRPGGGHARHHLGRPVDPGPGLGYVEKEFEAFGVPTNERAGRLIEALQFLDRFLTANGPIDFECPFFEVSD